MDKTPYRPDMIFNFFRKRKRFSDKARNSLSHHTVETLYIIGFPAFFPYRTMSLRRENNFAGSLKICITYGALTINAGKRIPQPDSALAVTATDINPDNHLRLNVFCRPYPYFIAFVSCERPHLIAFDSQPLSLSLTLTFFETLSYFLLTQY